MFLKNVRLILVGLLSMMFSIVSFASTDIPCFSLAMRADLNDPGQMCLKYPEKMGEGAKVKIYLFGYSTTSRYLLESFDGVVGPSSTAHHGRFSLWTTFKIKGQGKLFSVDLTEIAGRNPNLFSSVAIRNLQDNHLQNRIIDRRK